MSLVMLTPGVRTREDCGNDARFRQARYLFMAEPLRQEGFALQLCPAAKVLSEDELLRSWNFEELNRTAFVWARQWCEIEGIRNLLLYGQLNLGGLVTNRLTYLFLGVIKAVVICQSLSAYIREGVIIVGDSSYWQQSAEIVFSEGKTDIHSIPPRDTPEKRRFDFLACIRPFVKILMMQINRPLIGPLRPGKVLFSLFAAVSGPSGRCASTPAAGILS